MSNGMEARDLLKNILERHGLECIVQDDWILPNSRLPAIRALYHPHENSCQLSIQLLSENEMLIEECFAGIGKGTDGLNNALYNFAVNSLHVFLAAFWDVNDSEQILTEQWQIADKSYIAYIGNIGTRASEGTSFNVPQDFFPELEKVIKAQLLCEAIQWVRVFFCNFNGEWTLEALLNNQEWQDGITFLNKLDWPKESGYYSARNFIILREKI